MRPGGTGNPLCVWTPRDCRLPGKGASESVRRPAADEHGQTHRPSGPGGSPRSEESSLTGPGLGKNKGEGALGLPHLSPDPPPPPTHLALKIHGKFTKHLHEGDTFYRSSPQLLPSSHNSYPTPAISSSPSTFLPDPPFPCTPLPRPPSRVVFPRSLPPSLAPAP